MRLEQQPENDKYIVKVFSDFLKIQGQDLKQFAILFQLEIN